MQEPAEKDFELIRGGSDKASGCSAKESKSWPRLCLAVIQAGEIVLLWNEHCLNPTNTSCVDEAKLHRF